MIAYSHLQCVHSILVVSALLALTLTFALTIEPAPKTKGSGIYRKNNWAYVDDEEESSKAGEKILHEAQQISALSDQASSKMTRAQFMDLKSKFSAAMAAKSPSVSQSSATKPAQNDHETSTRPSRRTSKIAINHNERNESEEVTNPSLLPPKTRTPSTLDSPVSHGSTPAPGLATRSTSASTAPHQPDSHQPDPNAEPLTKPKKTWNAIVYEVFVNSTKEELTLADVQRGVKELYPFYALPQNASVLESSPRNPLYSHPSFQKIEKGEKKVVWRLKAGDFLDPKSKKILSSGPNQITPSAQYRHVSVSMSERTTSSKSSNTALQTPTTSRREVKRVKTLPRDEPTSNQGQVNTGRSNTKEASSRAVSRDSPQEVPETQLPTEVPETQVPSSSPYEIIETQGPSVEQVISAPESREQRRLVGIVHKNLVETFDANEIASFLEHTKLSYFSDMAIDGHHVAKILDTIFTVKKSLVADMETCAGELKDNYDQRVWGSEWLYDLVSSYSDISHLPTLPNATYNANLPPLPAGQK